MPHGEGKREGESQGEDVKSSSHLLEVELVIIIGVGLLKEHGVLTCKRARLGCLLLHRLARRRSVRVHPVDGLRGDTKQNALWGNGWRPRWLPWVSS